MLNVEFSLNGHEFVSAGQLNVHRAPTVVLCAPGSINLQGGSELNLFALGSRLFDHRLLSVMIKIVEKETKSAEQIKREQREKGIFVQNDCQKKTVATVPAEVRPLDKEQSEWYIFFIHSFARIPN